MQQEASGIARFQAELEAAELDLIESDPLDSVRIVGLVLELEQGLSVEPPSADLDEIWDF